jgi:7-carboxy-7-deazaguanine synthase
LTVSKKPALVAGFFVRIHALFLKHASGIYALAGFLKCLTEADSLFSCYARGDYARHITNYRSFYSLQGETRNGWPAHGFCAPDRLPLRCQYCDSAYAFSGGTIRTLDDILEQVAGFGRVTSVSPAASPGATQCHSLAQAVVRCRLRSVTGNQWRLDISAVDSRVSRVVDLKTPGSKEAHRNRYENIELLTPNDQVKFVICSREDYDWAVSKLIQYGLDPCGRSAVLAKPP